MILIVPRPVACLQGVKLPFHRSGHASYQCVRYLSLSHDHLLPAGTQTQWKLVGNFQANP